MESTAGLDYSEEGTLIVRPSGAASDETEPRSHLLRLARRHTVAETFRARERRLVSAQARTACTNTAQACGEQRDQGKGNGRGKTREGLGRQGLK